MKTLIFSLLLLVSLVVFATAEESSVDEVDDKYFGFDDDDDDDDNSDETETPEPTTTPEPRTRPPRGGNHRADHRGRNRGPCGRFNCRNGNSDDTPATRPNGGRRHHRGGWNRNMTDEEKINKVCEKLSDNSPNRGKGDWFGKRLSAEVKQQVQTIVQRRKTEMLPCCSPDMVGSQRVECVEEILVARYDRVCNNEEPLCLHSFIAQAGMTSTAGPTTQSPTISACCAKEGSERSKCFQEAKQKFFQQKMNHKKSRFNKGRHHARPTPNPEVEPAERVEVIPA